ncbi:MAG: hypothetical protein U0R50_15225 [Gaiellales bacterium]
MLRSAQRPRDYVAVSGPDAVDFVNRMVSNDIAALAVGRSCDALLLTAKARIIAPLVVWRRGEDDVLLLTEPGLGSAVLAALLRARLRARCEVGAEEHDGWVLLGAREGGVANADYGVPAVEVLDGMPTDSEPVEPEELELLRIRARRPRWGRELNNTVLPAEAGLDESAISFTKGCYPGQEPVARLRHRGHANRTLRVLHIAANAAPDLGAELYHGGKAVGRVTSVARADDGVILGLGYVRREVDEEAELELSDGTTVRIGLPAPQR